jgi:hypothetical protein
MFKPRAIQPYHFQAILSWRDGTFKSSTECDDCSNQYEINYGKQKIQFWGIYIWDCSLAVHFLRRLQGVTKGDVVYWVWPIASTYVSDVMESMRRGRCELSLDVCSCSHGAQTNSGDLTPSFTYGRPTPFFFNAVSERIPWDAVPRFEPRTHCMVSRCANHLATLNPNLTIPHSIENIGLMHFRFLQSSGGFLFQPAGRFIYKWLP